MIDDNKNKDMERRLAEIELKFERRFRHLQDAYESRLALVEGKVKSALARVEEIGEDVTITVENTGFLNEARKAQQEKLGSLEVDMADMEVRVGAAFDQAFPDNPRYAAAFLDIIDKDWRKDP